MLTNQTHPRTESKTQSSVSLRYSSIMMHTVPHSVLTAMLFQYGHNREYHKTHAVYKTIKQLRSFQD